MKKYANMYVFLRDVIDKYHLREIVLEQMKNNTNKFCNHIYLFSYDILSGISLSLKGIETFAYAQVGMLIRQLYEQVSIATLLVNHPECREMYSTIYHLRVNWIETNKPKKDPQLIELYNNKKTKFKMKPSIFKFSELGWLCAIDGVKSCSWDEAMRLAGLADLTDWKKLNNNFVHHKIQSLGLNEKGWHYFMQENIYQIAIIFDMFMCYYHNLNNYDFKIDNHDLRTEFQNIFEDITECRNS